MMMLLCSTTLFGVDLLLQDNIRHLVEQMIIRLEL